MGEQRRFWWVLVREVKESLEGRLVQCGEPMDMFVEQRIDHEGVSPDLDIHPCICAKPYLTAHEGSHPHNLKDLVERNRSDDMAAQI